MILVWGEEAVKSSDHSIELTKTGMITQNPILTQNGGYGCRHARQPQFSFDKMDNEKILNILSLG